MRIHKKNIPKDEPIKRPKTAPAKTSVVLDTFAAQPFGGWDDTERDAYLISIGLKPFGDVEPVWNDAELDLILGEMEAAGMILFE